MYELVIRSAVFTVSNDNMEPSECRMCCGQAKLKTQFFAFKIYTGALMYTLYMKILSEQDTRMIEYSFRHKISID